MNSATIPAMKLVIIESPYAGDIDANTLYARAAVRDSLNRGEAPIASHLLYPQPGILREEVPAERAWGIAAGLAWRKVSDLQAFYIDNGWSNGMRAALQSATLEGRRCVARQLNPPFEWETYVSFSQMIMAWSPPDAAWIRIIEAAPKPA